ncbi:hypothetical protein AH04_233 [Erwinia phage AH04]|uniref:Uncharacterized protein n=1 Tax=Erwinia phage AH04 TaxID=2869569 RepID=A0AAE8BQ89_9CAUD|nr:hypothetical protein PQC02_gp081 [Erwinia phage AH04]QZA70768.1 hypothetical protein AH04_233 [Erwinia phage AH04]
MSSSLFFFVKLYKRVERNLITIMQRRTSPELDEYPTGISRHSMQLMRAVTSCKGGVVCR